jgi:tRNA modification GTPase
MEKALAKMQQADVVIYLFDVNEISVQELQTTVNELNNKKVKYILVGNKADMLPEAALREKFSTIPGIIFISAKANEHTEVLKEKLVDLVLQGKIQTDDTIITNARHFHALQEVLQSLTDIRNGFANNVPADLVALDIRRCLHYLGEITGEITTEDQLDYIFSKFCIGK